MEKRKFERLVKCIPVNYSLILGKESLGMGRAVVRNIGEGGMFIEAGSIKDDILRALSSRECRMNLEIALPEENSKINMLAEVVWMREPDFLERKIELGIRFDGAIDAEKEKLVSYVHALRKKEINREMEEFLNVKVSEELLGSDRSEIIGKLEADDIKNFIPERGRAFFAQRAVIGRVGDRIKIFVTVPITFQMCEGHMVNSPFLPLGIAGWILSQAGEILVSYLENGNPGDNSLKKLPVVCKTGPVNSGHKGCFVPGDTLLIVGILKRRRLGISEVDTEAWMDVKKVIDVPGMIYVLSLNERLWS
ncbi:MAG: PilZ domain-containing protein [Candidatus Omnitrophica bacterium]|nr:PilZ domain-containing protein [Candidatus Omnitrophota bacterium]